jgi:hypothetical protein
MKAVPRFFINQFDWCLVVYTHAEIKAENLTEVMSWMQQAMNAGNPSASAVHQVSEV